MPDATLNAALCVCRLDASPPQEAEDIFGNVDELLSMYEEGRRARAAGNDGGEAGLEEDREEEGYDDEGDEEAAEQRRLARVRCCRRCRLHGGRAAAGWRGVQQPS